MEHMGHHLEKDRKNVADTLDSTTWNRDQKLEEYLLDEGLVVKENGQWKLGDGKPTRPAAAETDNESEEE